MTATIAAIVTAGLAVSTTSALANMKKGSMEQCYGIAKAGMNDCGSKTGGNSCSGQSKTDGDPNEWILVPKGTCNKIVNGSTTPGGSSADASQQGTQGGTNQ